MKNIDDDNKCFKCCLVRYLHPADHNPRRITKASKVFSKKLDFTDINLPGKIRAIHKIEKNNFIGISVFYENEGKYPIYVSKKCFEESHDDLILTGEERKRHYIIIKKNCCRYCLPAFSVEEY